MHRGGRSLVIAIGNPLRGDDGVGWAAAAALEAAGYAVIVAHQPNPEMAEAIARAGLVLFLDAAAVGEPGAIACRQLAPAASPPALTHDLDPPALLAGARDWYGAAPPAFLLTIAGASFALSETLSPPVARALPDLIARARALVDEGA